MTEEKKSNKKEGGVEAKIEAALEKLRPGLQMDGGDVKLVEWDPESGVLKVALLGACTHCPMGQVTLKQGIETEVKKEVPEVKEVVSV